MYAEKQNEIMDGRGHEGRKVGYQECVRVETLPSPQRSPSSISTETHPPTLLQSATSVQESSTYEDRPHICTMLCPWRGYQRVCLPFNRNTIALVEDLMAERSTSKRLSHALAELLVITSAHALIAFPQRLSLHLRNVCARCQGILTLALSEIEYATSKQLNFALAIARIRILVRLCLRVVRVWSTCDRGNGSRGTRGGELPDIGNKRARGSDVANKLGI